MSSSDESVDATTSEQQMTGSGAAATSCTDATPTTFEALGIRKELSEACADMGFRAPTAIQKEAIPHALAGKDIIGLAQTGSGKTAAFGLPILQSLLDSTNQKRAPGAYACIMAPTRELCFQISEHLQALGSRIGVRTAVVVGGIDSTDQAIQLVGKNPHIIVGTPGRLLDHLEHTKGFHLRNIRFLVMDEADRLLNMDFEEEINKILAVVAPRDQRQTFLFSATMTSKVAKLQRASLTKPVKVEVSSKYSTVDTLIQQFVFIPAKYKDCYLAFILNEFAGNTIVVFVHTCNTAQRLALMLRSLGYSAVPLHGQMAQPKRLGALNKFKSGARQILIATDVASRGLDIPSVDAVFNYDIPQHSKDYIHRVGRAARAGRAGKSITFVTQYDVELFQRIEALIGKKMDQYSAQEEQVLQMQERVSEASRAALQELKELEHGKKDKKHSRDEDDPDVTDHHRSSGSGGAPDAGSHHAAKKHKSFKPSRGKSKGRH